LEDLKKSVLTINIEFVLKGEEFEFNELLTELKPSEVGDFLKRFEIIQGYSPNQSARVSKVLSDHMDHLNFLADQAKELLASSLDEYCDRGMYRVTLTEDPMPDSPPDHLQYDGIYWVEYTTAYGGWRIHVNFDSADFPVFESVLQESQDVKSVMAARMLAILKEPLQ